MDKALQHPKTYLLILLCTLYLEKTRTASAKHRTQSASQATWRAGHWDTIVSQPEVQDTSSLVSMKHFRFAPATSMHSEAALVHFWFCVNYFRCIFRFGTGKSVQVEGGFQFLATRIPITHQPRSKATLETHVSSSFTPLHLAFWNQVCHPLHTANATVVEPSGVFNKWFRWTGSDSY